MTNSLEHPLLAGLDIEVRILQAQDLIAKDRNALGKRTTSDPFCEVYCLGTKLGTTKTILKTTSPVWKDESFQFTCGADATSALLRSRDDSSAQKNKSVELRLYDQDKKSHDDFMGTVVIPLLLDQHEAAPTWYPVTPETGNSLHCKNATGQVQVQIRIVGRQMPMMQRGESHVLQHNRITVGLAWDAVQDGTAAIDLDSSCVAVTREGNVDMNETVYYGNLANANRSLMHSGDDKTGKAVGDDETIQLELDRIPPHIIALYLILTVVTPTKTFDDVKSAQVRILSTTTKAGLVRIVPSQVMENITNNTALFLVRLARSSNDKWTCCPIEEGNAHARDFGSLIPEIKSYTRDLLPHLQVNPHERIAVMRKGGTINVSDYLVGHTLPKWVTFGLAWDVTHGVNIDLDASAICLNEQLGLVDVISFQQLTSKDGAIRHSGDEREGDEVGDDEKISLALADVSPAIKYIGIVINSYSGQELDDIALASCHLFDPQSHVEIAKYTLSNSKELDKHTALVMGCLYRSLQANGEWHLRIISEAAHGKTASDNVDELQRFLKHNPPQAVTPPPEPEIVVTAMPDAVPMDEEIVFVPQGDLQEYTTTARD